MNRRSAIKNLAIVTGGVLVLPSCLQRPTSIKLNNLNLDLEQENLLSEIAEAIIPATNTPGAKMLELHLLVMKMVDDCHEREDQYKFVNGLKEIDNNCNEIFNKPFIKLGLTQKVEFLLGIENNKFEKADITHFYHIMKSRTIQAYMNSKYVMTNLVKYELAPARYNGYFPVKI